MGNIIKCFTSLSFQPYPLPGYCETGVESRGTRFNVIQVLLGSDYKGSCGVYLVSGGQLFSSGPRVLKGR